MLYSTRKKQEQIKATNYLVSLQERLTVFQLICSPLSAAHRMNIKHYITHLWRQFLQTKFLFLKKNSSNFQYSTSPCCGWLRCHTTALPLIKLEWKQYQWKIFMHKCQTKNNTNFWKGIIKKKKIYIYYCFLEKKRKKCSSGNQDTKKSSHNAVETKYLPM